MGTVFSRRDWSGFAARFWAEAGRCGFAANRFGAGYHRSKLNIIFASTRRIHNKNKLFLRGNRVHLKPFLLDAWLDQYEHGIEFNLAASTGPAWTVSNILALSDDETRHRFLNHNLVYSRPAGADGLREAIAEMQGVPVEAVQNRDRCL